MTRPAGDSRRAALAAPRRARSDDSADPDGARRLPSENVKGTDMALSTLLLGFLLITVVLAGAAGIAWLTHRHPSLRPPLQAGAAFIMLAVTVVGVLVAVAEPSATSHSPVPTTTYSTAPASRSPSP